MRNFAILLFKVANFFAVFVAGSALAVITLVIIPVFIIWQLHAKNYCIGDGRYVSDQEILHAALSHELDFLRRETSWEDSIGRKSAITTHYSDVADALSRNPDCCKILRTSDSLDEYRPSDWPYAWIFGYVSAVVLLDLNIDVAGTDGYRQTITDHQMVPVSACGAVEVEYYRKKTGDAPSKWEGDIP